MAAGCGNAEAADRLNLSVHTEGRHRYSIYNKRGVATRIVAVHSAREQRLI